MLDRETAPWSWRPEGLLAGLSAESAAFLERALRVGAGLFPPGNVPLHLATLAQRGAPTISLGGASVLLTTSGSADLTWPGPAPDAGAGVAFLSAPVPAARSAAGPWGFLRLVDGLRPRARDGGRRFILDVDLGASRAFLDLTFDAPENPVTARSLARGLTCPSAL